MAGGEHETGGADMHETGKIVALVDGSIYSHSVCAHAAWAAGRTGPARKSLAVEVLHLLGRRETASAPANLSGNITLGARTALLEELSELDAQRAKLAQRRGRAILEDAKAVIEAAGVAEVATRLRFGDLLESLPEIEAEADLLVIGKRGEGADFARLHLGSNLERVVRACHKPVLVAARAFRPIARVLIAFDGRASSLKAVAHVARDPLFAGLSCHLLTVGADSAEARARLDEARATLAAAGLAVEAEIRPGQPESVLSQAVESEGIDLLVMGAYAHSRLRSLLIGSTTSEVVRACKIPALLLR